jgi:hypothetical protein
LNLNEQGQEPALQRADGDGHHFLTGNRIAQIGELIAPLLGEDLSWIERRKESVRLLDDTALRRQISVDFSLRSTVEPVLQSQDGSTESLFCAPVFVLPKSPSTYMSFDLCDEDDRSLALIPRVDNARISGEALVQLARRRLGEHGLPCDLGTLLRRVAVADAAEAEQIASRLLHGGLEPFPEALGELRKDERFCWWLSTLAHSSIVVVLFRSVGPRRKLIKLTFEEPVLTKQRILTRLGWASYRVIIDSPLIEARTFHFEAEAPPGLRISKAELTDSENDESISEGGFMKRVHLYRQRAESAGAGTAILWLDVSGPGFVGGAIMASLLTLGALIACTVSAEEIAANPSSAPALLLILPGLIASYVARPDQHALTTRLLSSARRLLLVVALCAYVAAARVALAGRTPDDDDAALAARADSLEGWLCWISAAAAVATAGLMVAWLRGKRRTIFRRSSDRFRCSQAVAMDPGLLAAKLGDPYSDCPIQQRYTSADPVVNGTVTLARSAWHGDWLLTLKVDDVAGESIVSATLDYVSLLPAALALPFLRRREANNVVRELNGLAEWADELRA